MPMDRKRYPKDWNKIALEVKTRAKWTCSDCGKQCIPPDTEINVNLGLKRGAYILTVHHQDYNPANNDRGNLIALCAPCHLRRHTPRRSNICEGQLSLFDF